MTLFIIIVAAIIVARALWNNPARAYQIANRITLLLLIAGVIYCLVKPAHSAETLLPQKLWGEWKSIDESVSTSTMKLDATSIGFGVPACKITSVAPANEDGTAFNVGWHCHGDRADNEIKQAFRLAKVHGKDILMTTNPENPTGISIYDRVVRKLSHEATNQNFGKADDYGSERYATINDCMVKAVNAKAAKDPTGKSLTPCMRTNGFVFCPGCQVFGNAGPRCKSDEFGYFHSWCWKKESENENAFR